MTGSIPTLTRAESEIMQVLWSLGRATVHEVVAGLDRDVAYTTALTMLRSLSSSSLIARRSTAEQAWLQTAAA